MNNLRKNLKNIPLIKTLSSLKITVVCLSLLFILTLWGTIAQVDQGLYAVQHRFFYSWFFTFFGFLPFPGAQLVLWILFINLSCTAITRFVFKWSYLGILIIHIGLLSYFFAAFVTFNVTKESNVTLLEGGGTNVSVSYHSWELAIWNANEDMHRNIVAFDADHFKSGEQLMFKDWNFLAEIQNYYPNVEAYTGEGSGEDFINHSGIKSLRKVPVLKEPEQNMPGLIIRIKHEGKVNNVLLYGGESQPTQIKIADKTYNLILRKKRFELPFTLLLKDFDMEFHPGTEIASRYQSLVTVNHDGLERDVLIYMNNPMRHKDYTLYQASYAIDAMGRQHSTLAVVKNAGQVLPYISSLVTFLGLVVHFLSIAFKNRQKS